MAAEGWPLRDGGQWVQAEPGLNPGPQDQTTKRNDSSILKAILTGCDEHSRNTSMPGFNEAFLEGVILPIPSFRKELAAKLFGEGRTFAYPNYMVVMNGNPYKRSPAVVCLNIDQNQLQNTQRRASAAWGSTVRDAQLASDETFTYSNSTLQHENLNQDEWLGLEEWVHQIDLDKDGRITSMIGPIYADFDRSIRPQGGQSPLYRQAFSRLFPSSTTKPTSSMCGRSSSTRMPRHWPTNWAARATTIKPIRQPQPKWKCSWA